MSDIPVAGGPSAPSHSAADDGDEAQPRPAEASRSRYLKAGRASRACDPCSKVKMRCQGGANPPCQRCSRQGYECTFNLADERQGRGRKRTGKRPHADVDHDHTPDHTASSSSSASGGQKQKQSSLDPLPSLPNLTLPSTSASSSSVLDPFPSAFGPTWQLPSGHHQPSPTLVPPFNETNSTSLSEFLGLQDFPEPTGEATTPQSLSSSSIRSHNASASASASASSGQWTTKDQPSVSQLSNPLGLLVLASLDVPKVADGPDVGNGADAQASRFDDTTERNSKASSNADLSEDDPTRTHPRDIYFRPAGQPYLLKRKKSPPAACQILNAAQIQELFDIFYNNFHIHAPLLDKEHGSPEQITARSHFLFHAICGIALRAWNGPEETQKKMLKIISAELKLFPQERTLECVQANLLCATWNPVAPQHIDLDEQYVRVGLAVRLAMDLGLHETDADRASDVPPWVLRSQRRTWALCFIFDAKLAAHRHRECYTPDVGLLRLEQDGSADDRRMLSSVEWCRIVLQISGLRQRPFNHTSPLGSGMSKQELELEQCASIDARLLQWKDKWVDTFMQASGAVQTLLARTRLYYYYAQLLNYANGLQSLAESEGSSWNDSVYANKYVDVVNRLLYTFIEDFGIHHIAAYLSDLHFTYIAFTAVSLIHSISIGLGRRNHEGPSTLRLLNRVADLFQVSAGQYGHNLKNQAEFIRAVIHAKLDDNGQPRQQPVPVPTDWMGPGFNDVLFGLPSPSNQEISDPWGFAVPVIHEGQSLDAFLNTNQILNNVHQFDYAYWSAALTSRHGSPTLP